MKVCKFGGTSLCDAKQFHKVYKIIKGDSSRRYVIVSAPGKRFLNDIKVTDALYECCEKASRRESIEPLFHEICERYNKIIKDLGLQLMLDKEYEVIYRHLNGELNRDYIASRGEYLNGMIMAAYLEYDFIDAADVIVFNSDGSFHSDKTNSCVRRILKEHPRAVIPGFYGADDSRKITAFSRGGSDITGALVAKGVCADVYENWTDVPGFLMVSPALIPNAKKVDYMCYGELLQLGRLGAAVFHSDAVLPLRETGIPIHIRNTNTPKQDGTMICRELPPFVQGKAFACGIAVENVFDLSGDASEETVLLHLIGYGLSAVIPDIISALRSADVKPLFVKESANDCVFGIKKQQMIEASSVIYAVVGKK